MDRRVMIAAGVALLVVSGAVVVQFAAGRNTATPSSPAQPITVLAHSATATVNGVSPSPMTQVTSPEPAGIVLPPDGSPADYQLGGSYPPPAAVGIVARDRLESPAAGVYSICYVNAFQTQPGEQTDPALVLRDSSGDPVIDEDWGETLFDTTTADARQTLLETVGPWIDGCAVSGFDAVEFDNLDSWSRSNGLIDPEDNLAMAGLLVARAHQAGLAAAQKNAAEYTTQGHALGFDFAVAESCAVYDECDAYTAVYSVVIEIEYTDAAFAQACAERSAAVSVVRRDHDLVPLGTAGYVAQWCS